MNNIPDYIVVGITRLNEFLPNPTTAKPLRKDISNKIPYGLAGAYDFFEAEIMGKRFLLAGIGENEEDMSPTAISQQRDVLQRMTGLVPIFIFNNLASYIFPRYTKKNLNVIVGGKQLFMPAIFLIATKYKNAAVIDETKIPSAFQPIVLYNLQCKRLDGMTTREMVEMLGFSYATINRCIRWMKKQNFIKLEGRKEKKIFFLYQGKELWDKTLPFLENPIDFIVHTPDLGITEKALISEQNALAEYSMLNGGPHRIAISKAVYKELKDKDIYWDQFGESGVEVWKYDPMMLSRNGIVDKLSLYLMLKDYEDERVQIELENMMKKIKW